MTTVAGHASLGRVNVTTFSTLPVSQSTHTKCVIYVIRSCTNDHLSLISCRYRLTSLNCRTRSATENRYCLDHCIAYIFVVSIVFLFLVCCILHLNRVFIYHRMLYFNDACFVFLPISTLQYLQLLVSYFHSLL